ncbi:MAG TPA: metalloregulator ArsR/SmtB family transcription factor [Gemmatimonadales bacterium]
MAISRMSPALVERVADRFRALAEPARLQILQALRDGERSVGELVEETGLSQANVSKHLQLLLALGFVTRRKEGLYAFYALADDDVFRLCDIMCGRMQAELEAQRRLF